MINKVEHPVAWSLLLYELEDAREHLGVLIKEMTTEQDFAEPELRISLGHVAAHLNRAWNSRNSTGTLSPEQRNAFREFPQDLEPIA